jgi:hypothetical protein
MAQHADHESEFGCSIDAQFPQQVIIRLDTEAGTLRQGDISVDRRLEEIDRRLSISRAKSAAVSTFSPIATGTPTAHTGIDRERGMNVIPPIPAPSPFGLRRAPDPEAGPTIRGWQRPPCRS